MPAMAQVDLEVGIEGNHHRAGIFLHQAHQTCIRKLRR